MSRVPRASPSNSNLRSQARSPSTPLKSPSRSSSNLRVPTVGRGAARTRPVSPSRQTAQAVEKPIDPPKEKLSLKEQIALKRAEAKKVADAQKTANDNALIGADADAIPTIPVKASEDINDLGRWSIRETVERARNTGNITLSSRSLPCIPSCLFEIHLGITPKPLDSVTEPEYPVDENPRRVGNKQTSWFEAQDLVVLKARSNEIVAIQPELSLFGSLKVIDLHSNRLSSLPSSLTILSSLTTLDVSNNNLSEFPPSLFSLPALTTLNLANNNLRALPFAQFSCSIDLSNSIDTGSFFQPEVSRAAEPLPSLHALDVGHNKLTANGIDVSHIPAGIQRLTLSHNPLGKSNELFIALGRLKNLQEIHADHVTIKDDSFDQRITKEFPKLQTLDLSETDVTEQTIRSYFANSNRAIDLNFEVTTASPTPNELRVLVGKKVIREAWEIEAEKNYLKKKKSTIGIRSEKRPEVVEKEPWELEAENGLNTKAGLRRAQLAAAASSSGGSTKSLVILKAEVAPKPKVVTPKVKAIEKEQWEIEAERGLLTEGGRRRLRAQQAAETSKKDTSTQSESTGQKTVKSNTSLSNSSYYSTVDKSLKLPSSTPPSRSHVRAFSMAASMHQHNGTTEDLLVPVPTLPLAVISRQDFASTLQVLDLSNRRADPSFVFPSESLLSASEGTGGILPRLSELILDGCGLTDLVSVAYESGNGTTSTTKQGSLIELIANTFPSLSVLDLSYNALTSEGLPVSALEKLLVPSESGRGGLRILRLRGNRISALDAFEPVANLFRGNRRVAEWRLEELDVRDNEIGRLSPLLGLLSLDVFLVDGNVFRIPQRKIWEREGTKGLLSWLRGRIE